MSTPIFLNNKKTKAEKLKFEVIEANEMIQDYVGHAEYDNTHDDINGVYDDLKMFIENEVNKRSSLGDYSEDPKDYYLQQHDEDIYLILSTFNDDEYEEDEYGEQFLITIDINPIGGKENFIELARKIGIKIEL